MEVSIVPAILVLARRVGILVQNIAGPEIVHSDLDDSRKTTTDYVVANIPLSNDPNWWMHMTDLKWNEVAVE